VTQTLGATLLHFLWQGTVITAAAAVLLSLLRRTPAQTRYVVACVALGALLAAPALTALLIHDGGRGPAIEHSRPAPSGGASQGGPPHGDAAMAPVLHLPASATALDADRLHRMVVGAWLAGATTLMLSLAGGWWRLHRRVRRLARTGPASPFRSRAAHLAGQLGIRRAVRVVDAAGVETPMLIGWLRPVIVLPVAALAALTPAQVDAILVHELAHVRRHDALVNLLQVIAETLLFYHPGVWWVSGRIRIEREHCCDEVAAAQCSDPAEYAAALAHLETRRAPKPRLALPAAGLLLARIERVLGVRRAESSAPGMPAVAALAVCFATGVTAQGLAPLMASSLPDDAIDVVGTLPVPDERAVDRVLPPAAAPLDAPQDQPPSQPVPTPDVSPRPEPARVQPDAQEQPLPADPASADDFAWVRRTPQALREMAGTTLFPRGQYNFHVWESPDFEIFHPGDLSGDVVTWVHSAAARGLALVTRILEHDITPERIPIVLADTAPFASPDQQTFDHSRRRVVVPLQTPIADVEPLTIHWLAHIVVDDLLAREIGIAYMSRRPTPQVPLWVLEGIAGHLAGVWHPDHVSMLRDAVRREAIPPSERWRSAGVDDGMPSELLYPLGHAAIEFSAARWGWPAVRRLLIEAARGGPAGAAGAIPLAFGVEPEAFDAAFQAWLADWLRLRP
jgi:beta-lactamase regulating signal transducer with metallopeptidase domain